MTTRTDPAIRRQQVLDFLNKNGESTGRQLRTALNLSKGPITSFLRELRALGEITVREERNERASVPYYTAKALVTNTAANKRPNTFGFPSAIYRASDREVDRPIPNQGGQGACLPRTATYLETAG